MVEMQIVMGHQHGAKHLPTTVQVMRVGLREILAGIVTAVFVQRYICILCRALRILTTPVDVNR